MIEINKTFHMLAPILALKQMPKQFQNFLVTDTFTEERIQYYADIPDILDLDNIEIDPFCKHSHSYKMELINGVLKWKDGDALEKLKSLCGMSRDYYLEGDLDQVRYCLSKLTHYSIDSKTHPHGHVGKPWSEYHQKYEDNMGHFLVKHQNDIGELKFEEYKDVYKDSMNISKELWYVGNDVVNNYVNGKELNEEIAMDVCRKCIKGLGDTWLTIAIELKIL